MSITYPAGDERRAVIRRLLEAASQVCPVTAALAHLYGYTHPSQFEQDLERFLREVAASLNDHEERLVRLEAMLAPRARIGALALDVAFHMLRTNDTGRRDPVMFAPLRQAFPEAPKPALEEAVAELTQVDYATMVATIGHPIRHVRPTTPMFIAFDLAATGRDTRTDALAIARLWLDEEAMRNVFRLRERLGWEPRRLNPALSALRPVFPDGQWSRAIHPTLETTCVVVAPAERFQLRCIVESGRVD